MEWGAGGSSGIILGGPPKNIPKTNGLNITPVSLLGSPLSIRTATVLPLTCRISPCLHPTLPVSAGFLSLPRSTPSLRAQDHSVCA